MPTDFTVWKGTAMRMLRTVIAVLLCGTSLPAQNRDNVDRRAENPVLYGSSGGFSQVRGGKGGLAASIAVLFGVNTVTGVWNLRDARKDPAGRTRRTVHGGVTFYPMHPEQCLRPSSRPVRGRMPSISRASR